MAGGDGLQEVVGDKATALNEHARRTWLMLYEVKEPPGTGALAPAAGLLPTGWPGGWLRH